MAAIELSCLEFIKSRKVQLVIKGEKYTAPNIAASFKVDPPKSPKTMDISYTEGPAAGQTIKAIYKLDDDTLTICRAASEGAERPTEFAAPAGSSKMLFVMKRSRQKPT